MTSNQPRPTFLDRGTLIAFLIVMGFWIVWSRYLESKYPSGVEQGQTQTPGQSEALDQKGVIKPSTVSGLGQEQNVDGHDGELIAGSGKEVGGVHSPLPENTLSFSDDSWSFLISSKGMGLREINIKKFKTRSDEPILLGSNIDPSVFSTAFVDSTSAVDFHLEKRSEREFFGRAEVDGVVVEKSLIVDSSSHSILGEVTVSNADRGFKGLDFVVSDAIHDVEPSSFLAPSYDHQDWFVSHDDSSTRSIIVRQDGVQLTHQNVDLVALSSHYFTLGFINKSDLLPGFSVATPASAKTTMGRLSYLPLVPHSTFSVKFTAFAGPKSFDVLSNVDDNLTRVIDFGMFAIIARPLLFLLKFLYSLLHNWGWAIVGLTIIVRLLVLPFNVYSYRSMKVMQKIQPEMTRIRERYKDKPADQRLQMNQEIMELMRAHKANPMGGCLPMLLQLPVFIALYKVLGQSIELYRAPFMFWIKDLSSKDPFYVLPILMGLTMFVQQKITPTTMDPQQAKILMWMPVIFSLFMISLPSGLTLYIFVSTLFGIVQQFAIMRERTTAATVKEAKA